MRYGPSHGGSSFDVLACLLEAKHEVARLEGPSVYPSAVVIAEALLIDC
jgi:hypothetical protein